MQYRQFERTTLKLPVVLFYPPIGLVRGQSINICRSGMCIDTGLIMLAPSSSVELCFVYPQKPERLILQFDAEIKHCSQRRTGVIFKNISLLLPETL